MEDHAPTSTYKTFLLIISIIFLYLVGIMSFIWSEHVFDKYLHSNKKNEFAQIFKNLETSEPGDLIVKENKLYVINTIEIEKMYLSAELSELSVNRNGKLIVKYPENHHGMGMPISCNYCHKG